MMKIMTTEKDNLIATTLEGKITEADVGHIRSRIDEILKNNRKVDFYFEMHDFHGYDMKGFWADLKVDRAHVSDYGKMAFVGDKKWQEWAAKATDLATDSDVRYFDISEKGKAKGWIGLMN